MRHMIKPDLIVVHPNHLTYPLFQKFITEERKRFEKVIIVMTEMNTGTQNYQQYLIDFFKPYRITVLKSEPPEAGKDWRNTAINVALTVSNSPWVYFTEQDFTPQDRFWYEVADLALRADVFGYFQEDRLHPCCIFIKKELLDKTPKDFGAYPEKGQDHFGKFQADLEKRVPFIGRIPTRSGIHLNGLSQNIFMLLTGVEPNYNPPAFKQYCKDCLESGIPIPIELETKFKEYINADTGR